MRFWLKDSERKPDPVAVKTDDRKAILVGLIFWVIALAVLLLTLAPMLEAHNLWLLWTCAVGIGLGLAGLLYTHRRHG